MRIAIDAMGGDHAPHEIVRGVVEAAAKLEKVEELILVGDEKAIRDELRSCRAENHAKITVVHTSQVIEMGEHPAQAVRKKRDSSIARAVDMVKDGRADAVMSAGNTGAMVAASTIKLRTLKGVKRPAIAAVLPTRDRPLLLVDAGANTDCDATLLAQFAVMGAAYSKGVMGQPNPVIGLMSIGGEVSKGNEITKKAYTAISNTDLNFRGNVEGNDIFLGETDVCVCDGFVGNVVLKTSESAAHAIGYWMKKEFVRHPIRMLGALLLKGALRSMKYHMDPEMHGGAPLLGVNGIVIIGHGSSSHRAIFNAIRIAADAVDQHVNDAIVEGIAKLEA